MCNFLLYTKIVLSRYVFRVSKYHKKSFQHLTTFFMSTSWGDSKNMEEIEFSRWLFEGRQRQGKNVLPDGLNWLCYFAGSSKSHRENSISCIFLESPHQVDIKSIVKCWKDFLWYFTTLKTYRVLCTYICSSSILRSSHHNIEWFMLVVLHLCGSMSCASIKDWTSTVMFSKPNEYIIYLCKSWKI